MRIIEVTENNYSKFNNDIMKPNQKAIVKFYANWCGHCQELNKKWPELESIVKRQGGNGILASVSEPMMNNISCEKDVMGYPSIWYMVGGKKKQEYNGKREIRELVKFIKKKMGKCRKTKKRKRKRKKKNKLNKKKTRRKSRARKRLLKLLEN